MFKLLDWTESWFLKKVLSCYGQMTSHGWFKAIDSEKVGKVRLTIL